MADKKQLIYALTIQISKITLRVRFPCTVCCTLKTDGAERQIHGEGELHNGQAILNLTHITEIQIPAKKEYFSLDKKCMLLIYLKSSSGRIPAGSVGLPLMRAETRAIREISRIDKCPDKNAFIEFEMKLQKVEEKKDATMTTTLEKETRLLKNQSSQRNIKLIKSQSPEKYQEDKNVSRVLKNSQAESGTVLRRMASKRQQTRSSLFETYYSGQRKIGDAEKVFALERQIDSFKTKLMILETEVATKNQKLSESEKDAKQLQKKNEQLDLQLKSNASKMQYTERANKQLANQIKHLKEKAEQEKLNFQNAIKRLQIRENSYKQQIKTISQKLYGSENEKQRMIYEKNLSSNQFEGRQKKLRQSFKEKQKKLLEDRTSMLKKVDSLEKDIQKLKQEMGQAKSKNTDNIQQVHELKIVVESVESQKQRFRNECNDLRFELTKLKNEKHILEENLDSIGKFSEERRGFRKQLSDRDIENSQFKDRITSLEGQLNRIRSQNEELDKSLKEKCNSIKLLERDFNIIAKENGILMGDISDKQSKIASLMEELQHEMKRSKFFQGNAAELQQQFQSKQDALQRELRECSNYRTILQEEVDKLNQQLEGSSQQLACSMKDIHELEQMVEEKNEWIANLESQMIQLNALNQQWQMEKIELAEEKKELQETHQQLLEESQEREKELSARILSISQKWEENASQLETSLAQSNERVKILNNALKEREEYLASSNTSNKDLEKRLEAGFKQREVLIGQQTNLNSEINLAKNSIVVAKKEISDREAIIESLRNSIEHAERQSDELSKKCEYLTSDLKMTQAASKKTSDEFASYRQATYQVLDLIGSNLKSVSIFILTVHPDEVCNSKVNGVLKAIAERNKETNKNLQEKQQKLAQLSAELENLAEERDLKEKGLLAAGQHLQLLKKNTNQFGDEIAAKNAAIRQLNESIKAKEKEIQELQAANNKKILGMNSIVSQKNREYAELKHKFDQNELSLQRITLELKDANVELKRLQKERRSMESDQKSKLTLADSTLRTEMERVNALEAEKSFLQKELRQERQNLRKVMRELQSKCYQFEDLQLRLEEHDSIGSLKESELRKLRQNNSELKYLMDIICSFQVTTDRQSPFNAKLEKYLTEPASNGEIFKQKVNTYYQNLTNFITNNAELLEKFRASSAQLETASRELASRSKDISELQLNIQEFTKMRQRQNQSKMSLLKSFEDQKQLAQGERRLVEDIMKLLGTLEKEKKASVFVISPLKQIGKKLQEQTALMLKGLAFTINKNKREWDLANIRAKKNNSKREELVSPVLRP